MIKNKNQILFQKGTDNQSKYPSLELLHPRKTYVFTLNPSQEQELKIKGTRDRVIHNILPFFHANVKMYTEMSTKNQNIHYHGFIRWDAYIEISQFYLNIEDIKKETQFEIDIYTDPDQWWPYITKQCPQMDSICHHLKEPNILLYIYKTTDYNQYNPPKTYIIKKIQ